MRAKCIDICDGGDKEDEGNGFHVGMKLFGFVFVINLGDESILKVIDCDVYVFDGLRIHIKFLQSLK
jgi:hypothetical protein